METRVCSVSDCDEDHHAKGFCNRHYKKWKRGKLNSESKLIAESRKRPRIISSGARCRVHGCFETELKLGYCEIHYNRYEMLKAFSRQGNRLYLEEEVYDPLDVLDEDSEHLSGHLSESISYYDQ